MADLSILIPARNEEFLNNTIENVLENMRGDTEIIVVLDGYTPDILPPVHPSVSYIYKAQSIGQRAAVNEAAKISTAKYVMKLDAHCAVAPGFDTVLMENCEHDWTVVPRMYNLHAFYWVCGQCGRKYDQGPKPARCPSCQNENQELFEKEIVWKPRLSRKSDFMRFDENLVFKYWGDYEKRPQAKSEIADLMCFLGASFFMERDRYWELGGLDEAHGSWGQMGVEISCKSWLSGGRLVVNKKTWFSHMFRTNGNGFSFPYPISGNDQEKAREYSRSLWLGDKWEGQKRPFRWIIDHFAPVPGFDTEGHLKERINITFPAGKPTPVSDDMSNQKPGVTKGIAYYTDNQLDPILQNAVIEQLIKATPEIGTGNFAFASIGGKGVDLSAMVEARGTAGVQIILPLQRSPLTMFYQIYECLKWLESDVVFLCEHDVLYHPSHFDFIPPRRDIFYYNQNVWKVDYQTGQALFYYVNQTSGLCAYRDLLLEHYRKRIAMVEANGFSRKMGFEPGTHNRAERVDDYRHDIWFSDCPNIDIRHDKNLTPSRWKKEQFRNQRYTQGWTEEKVIPFWGDALELMESIRKNERTDKNVNTDAC